MKIQYIRKKFYIRISAVIFLALAFSCFMAISFNFYERGVILEECEQQLLAEQKYKMKADVDALISAIENIRAELIGIYSQEALRISDSLRKVVAAAETEQELYSLLSSVSKNYPYATIYSYARPEGSLRTFSPSGYLYLDYNLSEEDFRYKVKRNEINAAFWNSDFYLELGIYYEEDTIAALVKEAFSQVLQENIIERQDYVWINQIVDYAGGKNFTYQIVSPFYTDDINDELSRENAANVFEMEGIRRNGEVFFSFDSDIYNLQSLDSGEYLAYSKVYPRFNWIIGTALSYDEIERIHLKEISSVDEQTKRQSLLPILLLLTIIPLFAAFIYMVERKYFRMIKDYAMQLENSKRVYETRIGELKKDSDRDVVTNLYNRRFIVNLLIKQFEISKQNAKNYSVILSDIDFFKKVNDTYGHDAGDYVLREVASAMQNVLRSDDHLARYGGEEFLILLTSEGILTNEILLAIAEKLRRSVEGSIISYAGNEINVTMSFGVSSFYITDETYMDAVRRADAAMYESKQTGRNRVTIRDDE